MGNKSDVLDIIMRQHAKLSRKTHLNSNIGARQDERSGYISLYRELV